MENTFRNDQKVSFIWKLDSGSVGRAVASDIRSQRFESLYRHNLFWTLFTDNCIEKMKIQKKGREWPIFKSSFYFNWIKILWLATSKTNYNFIFYMCHSQHLFHYFVFSVQLTVNENGRWLDSNRRPLVSETTTLPTEPQPLSNVERIYLSDGFERHVWWWRERHLSPKVFQCNSIRRLSGFQFIRQRPIGGRNG